MNVQLCGCIFILLLFLPGINTTKLRPLSASLQIKTKPCVSISGDLTTNGGHRCSWQKSGGPLVSLLVNCSSQVSGRHQSYWCRYAGKPHLCLADGGKFIQYWEQLVEQLKKRQNACEGVKVLRAKICKKVNTKVHMKLTHSSDEGVRKRKKDRPQSSEEVMAAEEKLEVMTMSMSEKRVKTDLDLVQRFCSQGWSSVCSFFLPLLQTQRSR